MMLVFDRPQWNLLPDPIGVRDYANVSNRMEVALCSGTHHVAVAVPTGLFTLMRDVFKVDTGTPVTLSIEEVDGSRGDPRFVFSMLAGDDNLYDLWDYSEGSLPRWLLDGSYRV